MRIFSSSLLPIYWSFGALFGILTPAALLCATPLEHFNTPLEIQCGHATRECVGVLRVDEALGRHTGVAIIKSEDGEVVVSSLPEREQFKLEAKDVSDLTLKFSWDGDSNPDVISGSGLNCIDLTKGGAHSFIVSQLSAEPECDEDAVASTCPQFTVESRIYDSQDPTGQRFSSSVITRGISMESDLFIPFSNFTKVGPRGRGSFTCVGAISISFKFTGLADLKLGFGSISTNGTDIDGAQLKAKPSKQVKPPVRIIESGDVLKSNKLSVPVVPSNSIKESATSPSQVSQAPAVPTPARARKAPIEAPVFGSLVAE
jgi:hypothetical protein